MHEPIANTAGAEHERLKRAEDEAYFRLARFSLNILNWADLPRSPSEEHDLLVKFLGNFFNDFTKKVEAEGAGEAIAQKGVEPAQDQWGPAYIRWRNKMLAGYTTDDYLRAHAWLIREFIIPALGRTRPGTKHGSGRPKLFLNRDRAIAETVDYICEKYNLNPTPTESVNKKECGCSIVAKALKRCGIKLATKSIVGIWQRTRKQLLS
jgi:hypothetical protein